ncbi:DMT family transporter [Henriciella aquimarina]|uniref:DMT family transporter n=1 Tax=Henriciella aquimarina TaxID=545261 RepID=UPI000A068342|nr:DMT family transporter [Henriciella aquimarina]
MPVWIPITFAAAFLQNLRSLLQKKLRAELSVWGATSARFIFAAPFAVLAALIVWQASGTGVTPPGGHFFLMMAIGGLAQIVATGCMIHLFSHRNFAVGTAFTKTEVLQTALFSLVLLGEGISLSALLAIVAGLVGILLISLPTEAGRSRFALDGRIVYGLISGGLYGLSAVCFRGASLSLGDGPALVRASLTLAAVLVFQALVIAAWLKLREAGELTRIFAAWRVTVLVGLVGMTASLGWFTAMTLENAAHVRAVGQVEIIFTIATSWFVFKETINAREFAGLTVLTGSILALVLMA